MNPLQEHAHLFANGNFGVNWANERNFKLIGYSKLEPKIQVQPIDDPIHYEWIFDRKCTLIARPIEDMTDDEVEETPHYITLNTIDEEKQELVYKCRCKTLSARDQNYLLSIGVYPFDQQAFNDGTVININSI